MSEYCLASFPTQKQNHDQKTEKLSSAITAIKTETDYRVGDQQRGCEENKVVVELQ